MKQKKLNIRRIVQIFFFVLIGVIAVADLASLHAVCPFGGVVTLYNLATLGTFIQKIHASSIILMSLIFFLSVLFGSVFCGWICPLGSIQEWFGKIGRKLFPKKYDRLVPAPLDRILSYFRYVVLIWVTFVTAKSGTLMFANIDPYNALFQFWTDEVAVPSLIILAITLVSSLLIQRPWCRYLCPYGALLGLFNKIRIFKITRNPATCISCGKCDKACPMGINVSKQEKITSHQCISCYECTSEVQCPVADTVNMQTGSFKVKLKKEVKIDEN